MTWLQAILVYVVCWWLMLFMALPIGIKQEESPEPGISRAAPKNPNLVIKSAAVTVLAGLLTWGIDILIHSGIVAVQ